MFHSGLYSENRKPHGLVAKVADGGVFKLNPRAEGPDAARGFDGGARPTQLHRPETHDGTILKLILLSRAGRCHTISDAACPL
jgi:hypothetical protein